MESSGHQVDVSCNKNNEGALPNRSMSRKGFIGATTLAGAALFFRSGTDAKASGSLPAYLDSAQVFQDANTFNAPVMFKGGPWFDVTAFGAIGSGGATNASTNTTAIQAALTAAAGTYGGIVWFPPGNYYTNAALTIGANTWIIGGSAFSTQISNSTSDIFYISTSNIIIEGLALAGMGGGNCINIYSASFINVRCCTLVQWSTSHSAILCTSTLIASRFEHLKVSHENTATVPTIYLTSAGNAINCNVFSSIVFVEAGNYCIWIECTSGDSGYCSDNTIEFLVCEETYGGVVKLLSCFNTTIRQCAIFDMTAAEVTQDLFYVGRSSVSGGLSSKYTRIIQCGRRFGGTLPSGCVDIRLESGYAPCTIIEQCDVVILSGCVIDVGNNDFTSLLGMNTGVSILNYAASAQIPLLTEVNAGSPTSTPLSGALVVDSTNLKLWVMVKGTWRYATLT